MRSYLSFLAVMLCLSLVGLAVAQKDEPAKAETTQPTDAQAAADRYQKKLDEWKTLRIKLHTNLPFR